MSDLLMESEDALKQDRLMAFWKDNGSFIIAMVILTIFLAGALSFYRTWDKNTRETQTAQIIQMIDAPTFPNNVRDDVLNGDLKLRKSLKALPILQAIGQYRAAGKIDDALALIEALTTDKKIADDHRELGYILWAQTHTDAAQIPAILDELKPVANNENGPWYALANFEYGALLASQGHFDRAVDALSRIEDAKIAPETLRTRARDLANLYRLKHSDK